MEKYIPEIELKLKSRTITVPSAIYEASGIKILGSVIKSLLFSTDVAIIENTNADSIFAVYPFTPQLDITQAILNVAPIPVFAGVGGGITGGKASTDIAIQAGLMGAYGVVVNAHTTNDTIEKLYKRIDIPIIATIASINDDYKSKLDSGARILNVSGSINTTKIVKKIREECGKEIPIIATGGSTNESILETIKAGANAIIFSPPSISEIFAQEMKEYREAKDK